MLHDDEVLDGVCLELPQFLYQEIMECEVEAVDLDDLFPSQQQFFQAMLAATSDNSKWFSLVTTEDGLVYFLNVLLPTNMEMWSTWGTSRGDRLITYSRQILQEFDAYCPY